MLSRFELKIFQVLFIKRFNFFVSQDTDVRSIFHPTPTSPEKFYDSDGEPIADVSVSIPTRPSFKNYSGDLVVQMSRKGPKVGQGILDVGLLELGFTFNFSKLSVTQDLNYKHLSNQLFCLIWREISIEYFTLKSKQVHYEMNAIVS